MDENRFYIIIQILMNEEDYLSSETLATRMNVSSRTVRNEIKQWEKNICEHGAHLQTKTGKGVKLVIEDNTSFQEFYHQLSQMSTKEEDHQERIYHILFLLLADNHYHKLVEFSDFLYITAPMITSCLKTVRSMLKDFRLTLINRPHYGMCVEGSEFQKRQCMIFYIKDIDKKLLLKDKEELFHYLYQLLNEFDYQISESSIQQLYHYLLVTILRIQNGYSIETTDFIEHDIEKEKNIVELIDLYVDKNFQICFSQAEMNKIIELLYSYRMFTIDECMLLLSDELKSMMNEMLEIIYKVMNVDLRKDHELKTNLLLHLYSLDIRMKYQIRIKNPLLEEIKVKYSWAFEAAALSCSAIQSHYSIKIHEDEIAFIAILFNVSILRNKHLTHRKNILLVCSFGRGTSRLLQYEIQTRFSKYIKFIHTTNDFVLSSLDLSKWDYILTTIDLHETYSIPVIKINNFLDKKDAERIHSLLSEQADDFCIENYIKRDMFYTGMSYRNKKEAIENIVKNIQHVYPLPNEFMDYVFKREEYGTTGYAGLFALPHPYLPITDDSFVSVTILEKSLQWDEHKIKMIILLSTSTSLDPNIEKIYALLSRLLMNKEYIHLMIKEKKYDTFIELMKKLKSEENMNEK